ncbi:MAG: hypothetical protein ACI91R_001727 [Vicingaceae bacterium]|jgi:hypothetical protein
MTKSLRTIQTEINEEKPFSDCKLDRRKYAENLTNIIRNYPTGFVLALNNRWGDGKTFFINRWRQLLKKEGFQTIYYNAWKDDFADNALLSIIAELTEDIENPDKKLLENVLQKGTTLFARSLPILLKAVLKKGVGEYGFDELAELIAKETGDSFKKLIDEHKKQKETISDFKKALREFAFDAGNGKPLVFFIDELDRCKPSYAVEVLEVIKHFFDVDNIVFVLSIDKTQLANSVRGYYGSDKIDGNEYLKRFIDVEYSLPKPISLSFFFDQQYEKYNFAGILTGDRLKYQELREDNNHFKTIIPLFFEDKNLNLRQVERLMSKTRLIMYSFKQNEFMWPVLLTVLVYLNSEKPENYSKIRNREFQLWEIVELNKSLFSSANTNNKRDIPHGLILLEFAFLSMYSNYKKETSYSSLAEDDFKKTFASYSLDVGKLFAITSSNELSFRTRDLGLNYLLERIELNQSLHLTN